MRGGFEVMVRSGELTISHDAHLTSVQPSLVSFAQDCVTQTTVLLMGHLYNYTNLNFNCNEKNTSNAAIALFLYQEKGIEALTQLEGEFALVVIEPKQQQILALRDPLGSYPLYWHCYHETLWVSTNLRQLASRSHAEVNLDFMASFLTFPYASVELSTEYTAFKNIHRVLPGQLLAIQLSGRSNLLWHWDWLQHIPDLATIQPDEADEMFLHLFRQAIQVRVQSESFAAHLSGGRDSSSIVCVLAQLLKEDGASNNLHTLSLVYQTPNLMGEKKYIQMVIEQSEAVCPHFVDGDTALDFQWFTNEQIPEHDEPYAGLFHLAMEKELINTAHQLGVKKILGGGGAELLVESNRMHIADLICEGHWFSVLRHVQLWAQSQNQNIWAILHRYALEPLLFVPCQASLASLTQCSKPFSKLGLFDLPSWIQPEFVKNYALHDRIQTTVEHLRCYPVEQSLTSLGLRSAVGNWASWYLGAPLGIHITHPFLDSRLITFCLGLPRALREQPGIEKPVLHRAMQGILPEPIRTRRFQPNFNNVYWKGFSQNLALLEVMVNESRIDELGIFDKTKLLDAMQQHAVGIGNIRGGNHINLALALIAWLSSCVEKESN